MSTSTSLASGSTATEAAEVWIRPWDSVTGTRWTRWGPPSCSRRCQAPSPLTRKVTSFNPSRSEGLDDRTSTFQPLAAAYRVYMSKRSLAKRFASSPPSVPRISMITFRPALGSVGSSWSRSSSSRRLMSASARSTSVRARSRSSPAESVTISRAASRSDSACWRRRQVPTTSSSSLWRRDTSRSRRGSAETLGSFSSATTVSYSRSSSFRRSVSTAQG